MAIRVFLVEDSPIALHILENIINSATDLVVVGSAQSGVEALQAIPAAKPDVICTDFYLKEMDGLALIQQVMAHFPRPILVVSVAVGEGHEQRVGELLQAGAIDVLPKPVLGLSEAEIKTELLTKIRILAGVKVFTRPLRPVEHLEPKPSFSPAIPRFDQGPSIVGIGASTGGPQAVFKILSHLPAQFPLPILCTQHISEGFLGGLVSWMNQECALRVKIAAPDEEPIGGTVYYAPERLNLEIDRRGRLQTTPPLITELHCPAIDVMFHSLARHRGPASIGILLTGMGKDGAKGLQAIATMGGLTVAQDEQTCVVFGMPREAILLGAAQEVLPLTAIGPWLMKACCSPLTL
ncbi:chemotaxis protein CheB [Synechocystis sp. LKSZ1]|uniref:chemotaxis protein CheB n=1 Tax=Synechocystis sp. LKSZ1 TaxID=3144951 RepID=UPI00336C1AA3